MCYNINVLKSRYSQFKNVIGKMQSSPDIEMYNWIYTSVYEDMYYSTFTNKIYIYISVKLDTITRGMWKRQMPDIYHSFSLKCDKCCLCYSLCYCDFTICTCANQIMIPYSSVQPFKYFELKWLSSFGFYVGSYKLGVPKMG